MYKNIVIGFDESDYSMSALSEVAARVRDNGSHISLVHAVYHDTTEFDVSNGQLEKRMDLGRSMCMKVTDRYKNKFGLGMEYIVCEGTPDEVIVDVAKGREADIIAIGTHGRKGISRLLMGSVTAAVIENSPCDVLVVKKHCTDCSGGYKSILVAYDGSEHSKKALNRAAGMVEKGAHEITLSYVIPQYQEMIGFYKTAGIKDAMMEEAQKVLDSAEPHSDSAGVPIATVIQDGHPAEKIVELAHKLKCDLIVMGSHGWTGVDKAIMGSTTERVIVSAPCPVLVVR